MGVCVRLGLLVAVLLAVALLTSTLGPGSSEAQSGTMLNCPQAGEWSISVWSGDDGIGTEQALNTCGAGAVAAAYHIDRDTQQWQRYVLADPEISDLLTLDDFQAIFALGSSVGAASSAPEPTVFAAQAGTMHNCPQPETWAISVWDGGDGTDIGEALDSCGVEVVAAAYAIDADTQSWLRWIRDYPEMSTLPTIDDMQGVLALRSTREWPDFCSIMGAIPATYHGTVVVDGEPAAIGTIISAVGTDGRTWSTTTLTSQGSYAMDVPEPLPVALPCFPGGTVRFRADGAMCGESSEFGVGPSELDLHCRSAVGGIAELPNVSDSAGPSHILMAGLAGAALLALTAGAWYARRRWIR